MVSIKTTARITPMAINIADANINSADNRFSVKFYLVAISFLLFDVEVIFMFPWAVNVVDLGVAGLFKMFIFMGLLFIGLIYIYKKKALSWD